jgi:hypothetical protein
VVLDLLSKLITDNFHDPLMPIESEFPATPAFGNKVMRYLLRRHFTPAVECVLWLNAMGCAGGALG